MQEKEVVSILENTTRHGAIADKTQTQDIKFYNLDAIISVGYRINSKQATNFRKWAISVLKDHITQGYTVNQDFFKNRQADIQKAIETIRLLSQDSELITKNNTRIVQKSSFRTGEAKLHRDAESSLLGLT